MNTHCATGSAKNDAPRVLDLGLCPFEEVWQLQKDLRHKLMQGSEGEVLILCEHPPVITLGTSAQKTNILLSPQELLDRGISVHTVERGGDTTWHGPGQVLCYPILNLSSRRRDVGWYMRSLEDIIIRALQEFEIKGFRVPGATGIWTCWNENDSSVRSRKIASLGVRISRWYTMHGFSLNVNDCREGFSCIHPCGFQNIIMTSMEVECREQNSACAFDIAAVKESLVRNFGAIFNFG